MLNLSLFHEVHVLDLTYRHSRKIQRDVKSQNMEPIGQDTSADNPQSPVNLLLRNSWHSEFNIQVNDAV